MAEAISAHNTPDETAQKSYTPAATNLTVHSARNRRALEEQLKRKVTDPKTKEPLKFEHQLLLGHVSMLTDMQIATEKADGKTRQYIITSDRDEHIRISRGPPHAYIIERYCLGHTEFVNKMCLVPNTNLLLSAGGDDWLGVWDWTTGKLLAKRDLKAAVTNQMNGALVRDGQEDQKIAVSGIWVMSSPESSARWLAIIAIENCAAPILIDSDNDRANMDYKSLTDRGRLVAVQAVQNGVLLSCDPSEVSQTHQL